MAANTMLSCVNSSRLLAAAGSQSLADDSVQFLPYQGAGPAIPVESLTLTPQVLPRTAHVDSTLAVRRARDTLSMASTAQEFRELPRLRWDGMEMSWPLFLEGISEFSLGISTYEFFYERGMGRFHAVHMAQIAALVFHGYLWLDLGFPLSEVPLFFKLGVLGALSPTIASLFRKSFKLPHALCAWRLNHHNSRWLNPAVRVDYYDGVRQRAIEGKLNAMGTLVVAANYEDVEHQHALGSLPHEVLLDPIDAAQEALSQVMAALRYDELRNHFKKLLNRDPVEAEAFARTQFTRRQRWRLRLGRKMKTILYGMRIHDFAVERAKNDAEFARELEKTLSQEPLSLESSGYRELPAR